MCVCARERERDAQQRKSSSPQYLLFTTLKEESTAVARGCNNGHSTHTNNILCKYTKEEQVRMLRTQLQHKFYKITAAAAPNLLQFFTGRTLFQRRAPGAFFTSNSNMRALRCRCSISMDELLITLRTSAILNRRTRAPSMKNKT